jgi:hypothetical protein
MKRYTLILAAFSALGVNAQLVEFEEVLPPPPTWAYDHNLPTFFNGDVVFFDFDGDGYEDIFYTTLANGPATGIFMNNGDGSGEFTELTTTNFENVHASNVKIADFNGDGNADILYTGANASGVGPSTIVTKLYLGDGNLGFTEFTSLNLDVYTAGHFDVADVDGDGDLDVVMSGSLGGNNNNLQTRLYLNDGSANFTEVTTAGLFGLTNSSVAFADIDNDGDVDLLLTGQTLSDQFTFLYENDGSGSFTEITGTSLTNVSQSRSEFVDIDNDGDLDIILSGIIDNSGNFTFEIYTNDGDGNFSELQNSSLTFSCFAARIAAGDIDNDGDLDLIVYGLIGSSFNAHGRAVLINDGNGNFTEDVNTNLAVFGSRNFGLSDINNNGNLDLIIGGNSPNNTVLETYIYTNDGTGTFYEATTMPLTGVEYSSTAYADVDGDGDLDLLVIGSLNAAIGLPFTKLYLNNGNGEFTEDTANSFVQVDRGPVAFADVDGDGDQDLLIFSYGSNWESETKLYLNDGNGVFTEVSNTPFDGSYNGSIEFADVDNDGDLDVLITGTGDNWSSLHASLYINDGSGNYIIATDTPFEPVYYSSSKFADLDGDGDLDLILTGFDDADILTKVYINDGNANYTELVGTGLQDIAFGCIEINDFTGDGNKDIILSGLVPVTFEPVTKLYTSDGNLNFTEVLNTPFLDLSNSSVAISDVDSDGDLDIYLSGADSNTDPHTLLYMNDGLGNFSENTTVSFDNVRRSSLAAFDIDGDGDDDFIVTGKGETRNVGRIYRNITCLQQVTIDEIITCDASYTWIDGNTYTSNNNTAEVINTDAWGCESTIQLNLTINEVADITTTLSGATITTNNANATYQWVDCDDNNAPIAGETNQSFTATTNGNYAVEITENGCTATSDCIAVTTVGLDENERNTIVIYPNPAATSITITEIARPSSIIITDINGRALFTAATNETSLEVALDNFASGVYLVNVVSAQFKATQKLIVQ